MLLNPYLHVIPYRRCTTFGSNAAAESEAVERTGSDSQDQRLSLEYSLSRHGSACRPRKSWHSLRSKPHRRCQTTYIRTSRLSPPRSSKTSVPIPREDGRSAHPPATPLPHNRKYRDCSRAPELYPLPAWIPTERPALTLRLHSCGPQRSRRQCAQYVASGPVARLVYPPAHTAFAAVL